MKLVVIGGTGLIGSKLVTTLREHGHEAVAASPNTGVNTLTGEGLAEVLQGASVVVDVSNSPSFEDAAVMDFFSTSTRNLLKAAAAAGVTHYVALSVVGTERLSESGYFRAKIAQEQLIKESSIPYSIVHATQFFEFVKSIAAAATEATLCDWPPVLYPADGGRRGREGRRQDRGGNTGERHRGSGRARTVPSRRAHSKRPQGSSGSARSGRRPAVRATSARDSAKARSCPPLARGSARSASRSGSGNPPFNADHPHRPWFRDHGLTQEARSWNVTWNPARRRRRSTSA